ncbi:MAG TPA: flavin reductase family protein [Vicinamibacteria bacterium]|nr:flavin reductase family protein [Vicinamibacteria bacterium]
MTTETGSAPAGDPLRALALALAPRPVVLVATLSAAGKLNVAPFSMVTPLSVEPPLLGLGISPRREGGLKTTLTNIIETGEFVVNTAGEALLPAAVAASLDAGEPGPRRFETEPSEIVRPPCIAGAVAQLECRLVEILRPGGSSTRLVVGQIVRLHFGDTLLGNQAGAHTEALPGHLAMEAPGVHQFLVGGRLLRVAAEGVGSAGAGRHR